MYCLQIPPSYECKQYCQVNCYNCNVYQYDNIHGNISRSKYLNTFQRDSLNIKKSSTETLNKHEYKLE